MQVYLGIDVGSVTTKLAVVDGPGQVLAARYLRAHGPQTGLESGGQDSKLIIIRDGVVTDFGMNTVCAAGTGSFLDHQAERLNIRVEDFGPRALKSRTPGRIAGRCTVFAESDMVH